MRQLLDLTRGAQVEFVPPLGTWYLQCGLIAAILGIKSTHLT